MSSRGGPIETAFDVIVIGRDRCGAGSPSAAGASWAIVKRKLVPGECSFYACTS
jgi:pyruvate/2-oxoglutarate dehydrogenase complex dihydrolipoamide dehydrogenase (E3) component